MNFIFAFLLLVTLIITPACDRIRGKGSEMADKAKEKAIRAKEAVAEKADGLVDKVFPTYDHNKPDTENNKGRFKEHLQVELTEDVRNIFSYGDFMGIDYKVLMTFVCDSTTVRKIVEKKGMVQSKEQDTGLTFGEEFPWWNKNAIERIKPYKVGKENEYREYLWYDKETRVAYYEEFSL